MTNSQPASRAYLGFPAEGSRTLNILGSGSLLLLAHAHGKIGGAIAVATVQQLAAAAIAAIQWPAAPVAVAAKALGRALAVKVSVGALLGPAAAPVHQRPVATHY